MIRCTILSILSINAYFMLIWHPIPNKTVNVICGVSLLVLYVITFGVAYHKEQKLKERIEALEDKAENNAENIHQLAKKQRGTIIEYSID